MANAMFDKGLEALWAGSIDYLTDNIKVILVDHGTDTPVVATDEFHSDIAGGAIVATSGNLATKTVTAGVIDAADITITAVTSATVESILVYKDTGTSGTSPLIAYIDTTSDSSLPFTPNGGDVTISWNASGIVSIA